MRQEKAGMFHRLTGFRFHQGGNWADAQERFAAAREKTAGLLVLS